MQFLWNDLIDRARVYVDDDHGDQSGWISPAHWLSLANVEYSQLYRRWMRMGLITPATTDTTFTGGSTTITGVLAIVGVAQDMVSYQRILEPRQSRFGRAPFWVGSGQSSSPSSGWMATGSADSLAIKLDPVEPTGSYFVRYVPTVAYATDPTTTIDLPYGADERLVLGLARRAHLKDSTASALLERLIQDADAELNFTAFGRVDGDSPRVRRISRGGDYPREFPTDPRFFRYV